MNSLALHILDLANNSIRAKASKIDVIFCVDEEDHKIGFQILDNGIGMDQDQLEKVTDPFYTTRNNRKLGFGLPFIKMQTELTGGELVLTSTKGKGTKLFACFKSDHIDVPPTGDIAGVIAILLTSNPEILIRFVYWNQGVNFFVTNKDLEPITEGFPIGHTKVIKMIKQYIEDNILINKKLEVTE